MAYDPKKKRPAQDSLDAVVDEIFGEEVNEKGSKKPVKKASTSTKSAKVKSSKVSAIDEKSAQNKAKKAVKATSKAKSASKTEPKSQVDQSRKIESDEEVSNVLPLYPQTPETPLVMQPQVWVATGIAALILLLIARKKRKR